MDEARHTVDPVVLMHLFGLSATAAMNYIATVHPEQGGSIRR
ncbi:MULTISPECIES: hypothetical protein [unclassified Crossiella]|nr:MULTISPECIES: hypothetical protein [unclassified Crossiella]